ncbi:hypothetical protein LL06_10745 [Hoeflea sp. BAL378]|uniref:tripartite tricarboxylate transporter TctB family protein n=1 Tax=Hoeflea sp. BAL378 TaxID=1547437 RepID=UPI000512FB12|nr:tripartite tricarboxylate transporter TctB family protein [Hoeflea sp. BAL378]KGF69440.1 hypothetical protein LL06_10745 [Hoeflea sp. BAL378]
MSRLRSYLDVLQRERPPGDLVFALGFLAFCLFLFANLGEEVEWVSGMGLVSQPAFWPTVSVLGMLLFAILHVCGSLVSPRTPGRLQETVFWMRSLEYVAYLLVYVWSVPFLGYLPATVLFSLLVTFRLGYRKPVAYGAALLFAISVVLIFKSILQVNMPVGELYEHLPASLRRFAMSYL